MKKILVGKVIEEGHGKCVFCQSDDVDGFVGYKTVHYTAAVYAGVVKAIKGDWHYNWSGSRSEHLNRQMVIDDYDIVSKYETEQREKEIYPLICKDCVKQLADIK